MDGRRSGAIINSLVSSYIDEIYVNKNENIEALRVLAEENHVPIILKDAESLLNILVKIRNPKRILEIGTAVGYSASFFANACDADIVTIEADKDMHEAAVSNIENLGFSDRITALFGDAREVLEGLAQAEPFDFVFIDAAKSHYKAFWELAYPLCEDGALIACDNVLMKGMTASDEFDTKRRYKTSIKKMREFLSYINSLENVETSVLPVGDGVSISVINK